LKQIPGLRRAYFPHPGGPAPNRGLCRVEQWQHKDAIKIAHKIDFHPDFHKFYRKGRIQIQVSRIFARSSAGE
jgi:hypothetical protein